MEFGLENLKYVSLTLAVAGLLALAFLLPEEKSVQAGAITAEMSGEKILVAGTIKNLEIRNGNAFFTLENGATVKAVYFSPSIEQLSLLRNGSTVIVKAEVSLYRQETELIASEVREID